MISSTTVGPSPTRQREEDDGARVGERTVPEPLTRQALRQCALERQSIERRAIEAVNWGLPAVNYDLMRHAMHRDAGGKMNQVLYWSRPFDWKNQMLTPNPDVIYAMPFFDLCEARADGDRDPAGRRRRVDHRDDHGLLAGAAGGCRTGGEGRRQGWQVRRAPSRARGGGAGGVHCPALPEQRGLCVAALRSRRAAARRTSRGRSPTRSASASTRSRRRARLHRRHSSTRSTSCSTARSRTTCGSSNHSTASSSTSPGSTATRR